MLSCELSTLSWVFVLTSSSVVRLSNHPCGKTFAVFSCRSESSTGTVCAAVWKWDQSLTPGLLQISGPSYVIDAHCSWQYSCLKVPWHHRFWRRRILLKIFIPRLCTQANHVRCTVHSMSMIYVTKASTLEKKYNKMWALCKSPMLDALKYCVICIRHWDILKLCWRLPNL